MSSQQDLCLQPNPDIAGIGVRFAIYFQAFVTVIPLGLAVIDGKLDERERKILRTVFLNLLLTSSALLICAFIRHGPAGMNKYHLFIILDLCWINITTSLGHIGAQFLAMHEYQGKITTYISSGKDWFTIAFSCLHMSLTAALGLWTWTVSRANQFGCPGIIYSILGQRIRATNSALRTTSLVIYSTIAFPGINLIIALFLLLFPFSFIFSKALLLFVLMVEGLVRLLHAPFGRLSGRHYDDSSTARMISSGKRLVKNEAFIPFTAVLFVLACQIIFVVDIELIVKRNYHVIGNEENRWTFGQTLAIMLLVLPIIETIKQGLEWHKDHRRGNKTTGSSAWTSPSNEHLASPPEKKDEESHGVGSGQDIGMRKD